MSYLKNYKGVFTNSAPLGRVGHRVAMSVCVSVCLSVCLRHRVQFFSRPLIGPQITRSFEGSKHSELGPSSSSLAGWTHLKAASTVKGARHFLLLLDGHI